MSESGNKEHQESRSKRRVTPDEILPKWRVDQQREFEEELFRNGRLEYNEQQVVAAANNYLHKQKEWWEKRPNDEAEKVIGGFAQDTKEAEYMLRWLRRFNGKIPIHWNEYSRVYGDFDRAYKTGGITLSRTLIDAGITHPYPHIAELVGKTQRLNRQQLAGLIARPDFQLGAKRYGSRYYNELDKIIDVQRGVFEVPRRDIWAAKLLSFRLRWRMSREGKQGPSAETPLALPPSDTEQQ